MTADPLELVALPSWADRLRARREQRRDDRQALQEARDAGLRARHARRLAYASAQVGPGHREQPSTPPENP
jgi:ribosomal protein L13E